MGGKKKTKWRKLPPEDLSHITLKRRDGERTRIHPSSKLGNNVLYNSRNDNYHPSEAQELPFNTPGEVKYSNTYNGDIDSNELTGNGEDQVQPGFYVDGLWVPESDIQAITSENQVPLQFFQTVPIVVHQPASISPSPCPRLQTFHSPEVYVHPNYFVPNNNHYFYYLTRLTPKPVEVQTVESSNICTNPSDYPYQVVPAANLRFTEQHMDPSETLQAETEDGPDTTTALNDSNVHPCSRDQQFLTDVPFEGPEDIHAAYRYPGYGFGHPVYNIPFCALIPSTSLQALPNTPWSVVHLQKRRRRRRKGYAEYAIIPKKKNLSNTDEKSSEIQTAEPKPTLNSNELGAKKLNSQEKSTVLRQHDAFGKKYSENRNTQQNKKTTKIAHKNTSIYANEEVFHYANNLVKNIIKQAQQKLADHSELCSTSCRGTSDDSIPIITTINLKDAREDSIIVTEILQYILNKVDDESNVTNQALENHVSAKEHIKSQQSEKDTQIEKSLFLKHDKLLNNVNVFNKLKTVDVKNEVESNIFHESIERHMLDHSDYKNVETNYMFTKLALNMDVPDVHKKTFTSTENDNNTSQMKPKKEIDQVINNRCESNEHLTSLNVIFKSDGTSQPDATYECNGNNAKPTYHNAYSEEDQNTNQKNQVANFNGNQRKSVHKLETQPKNDQNMGQSELSPYSNNSNDRKPQAGKPEAAKETITSGNTYPAAHNTHLHNENTKYYDNSPSSQYSFVSHSVSSDTLIRETEMELNKIHQLTSNSNQSIYKLAYDENITDQSETEENDIGHSIEKEEPTCPKSCKNLQGETRHSEILVHEIDNASDAGSEDVELLPHRYESDTAKGCNKHVYVNNLSLAVELLRTRESLPYDDEFKRIVDDDTENKVEERNFQRIDLNHPLGSVNRGFIEDLGPFSSGHSNTTYSERSSLSQTRNVIQNCPQSGEFRLSTADSGVQSEDSGDEIGEEAKETSGKQNDAFCTSAASSNYRRFGAQTGQRFNIYTPRANMMNPCFCCIIM